jgi:hypothetical protein
MLYVTTEYPKFSPADQISSLLYLRRAFIIISDTDGVYNCTIVIRTLVESTYLKKVNNEEIWSAGLNFGYSVVTYNIKSCRQS